MDKDIEKANTNEIYQGKIIRYLKFRFHRRNVELSVHNNKNILRYYMYDEQHSYFRRTNHITRKGAVILSEKQLSKLSHSISKMILHFEKDYTDKKWRNVYDLENWSLEIKFDDVIFESYGYGFGSFPKIANDLMTYLVGYIKRNGKVKGVISKKGIVTRKDFTLYGKVSIHIVDSSCNYNLIERYTNGLFFCIFSIGDDIHTERGITIGSTKAEVFDKYGIKNELSFNLRLDELVNKMIYHHDKNEEMIDDLGGFNNLDGSETFVEYGYQDKKQDIKYCIRFYFDVDDKVVLIGYYNDYVSEFPKIPGVFINMVKPINKKDQDLLNELTDLFDKNSI